MFHMQESLQKSMHFDYLQYLCSVLSRLLSSSTASSWQVRDRAGVRGMVSVTTVPRPHAPLEVLEICKYTNYDLSDVYTLYIPVTTMCTFMRC